MSGPACKILAEPGSSNKRMNKQAAAFLVRVRAVECCKRRENNLALFPTTHRPSR